jgi:hypothetical protein
MASNDVASNICQAGFRNVSRSMLYGESTVYSFRLTLSAAEISKTRMSGRPGSVPSSCRGPSVNRPEGWSICSTPPPSTRGLHSFTFQLKFCHF